MSNKEFNKDIEFHDVPDGSNNDPYVNFKDKLEAVQQFPGIYAFKFIITGQEDQLEQLKTILPNEEFVKVPSKTGKYVSVTVKKQVQNAEEVIEIYKKVGEIKGIMML